MFCGWSMGWGEPHGVSYDRYSTAVTGNLTWQTIFGKINIPPFLCLCGCSHRFPGAYRDHSEEYAASLHAFGPLQIPKPCFSLGSGFSAPGSNLRRFFRSTSTFRQNPFWAEILTTKLEKHGTRPAAVVPSSRKQPVEGCSHHREAERFYQSAFFIGLSST